MEGRELGVPVEEYHRKLYHRMRRMLRRVLAVAECGAADTPLPRGSHQTLGKAWALADEADLLEYRVAGEGKKRRGPYSRRGER